MWPFQLSHLEGITDKLNSLSPAPAPSLTAPLEFKELHIPLPLSTATGTEPGPLPEYLSRKHTLMSHTNIRELQWHTATSQNLEHHSSIFSLALWIPVLLSPCNHLHSDMHSEILPSLTPQHTRAVLKPGVVHTGTAECKLSSSGSRLCYLFYKRCALPFSNHTHEGTRCMSFMTHFQGSQRALGSSHTSLKIPSP